MFEGITSLWSKQDKEMVEQPPVVEVEKETKDIELAEKQKNLEKGTGVIVAEVLNTIKAKYENNPDSGKNLDYHNSLHTANVMRVVEEVLSSLEQSGINLPENSHALGKIAAAVHDIIQEFDRDSGYNEIKSGEHAARLMVQINETLGEVSPVYTEAGIWEVRNSIEATKSRFDPETKAVVHDELLNQESSSYLPFALAWADVSAVGMDPNRFLEEGNSWFREQHIGMRDLDFGNMSTAQKEEYRVMMLDWLISQIDFSEGMKLQFEKEVKTLPPTAQKVLKNKFNRFDESAELARNRVKFCQGLPVEKLYQKMGYVMDGKIAVAA